jgi:phospholipase/lecithinase/hemolysin
MSDIGSYTPATQVPGTNPPVYFGGKFTTNNGSASPVWVENLATTLGLVVTPAEVGFNGQSQACPAAANPVLASTCTGYAQGGARVTARNGIGRDPVTGAGALTVPVKTQIANHLARFTSFKAGDLVMVFAGNNDVFVQIQTFGALALQIQTDAAAGRITPDEANRRLFSAQTAAQDALKQAAQELAGYIRTEILAKGARYVAVWTLPDSSLTPSAAAQPATLRPVWSGLVGVFNLWLRDGLANQPVQILDLDAQWKTVFANPAQFGFTNVSTPSCDLAKIAFITGGAVTNGSSLFCNATPGAQLNTLTTGADVTTWLFADDVHPTTGGHKFLGDFVLQQLRAWGWI